jgi:hypothetical protein
MKRNGGQVMLIAAFLLIVLVIMVPVMIFINQRGSVHGVQSAKRSKGSAIAEEGLDFACRQLLTTWPYRDNILPTNQTLSSAQGGSFSVRYEAAPSAGLQPYQVRITAIPYDEKGKVIPGSTLVAAVSQRTIGAKMPSGVVAPAALELRQVPSVNSSAALSVYFGPIVCQAADPGLGVWQLDRISDSERRPRKFSRGGIRGVTGANPARSETIPNKTLSDEKEFWAYTDVGLQSNIKIEDYITKAKNSLCPNPPVCPIDSTHCLPEPPASGNCYFPNVTLNDQAIFDDLTLTGPDTVVYVVGNATFNDVSMNLSPRGAIIVDGNLTLDDNKNTPVASQPTSCPPTRCLDVNCQTVNCANNNPWLTFPIDMQGFLYVTGNLVQTADIPWTLQGAARVDGQFQVNNGTFTIVYDDIVNHNILTKNFELEIDSKTFQGS